MELAPLRKFKCFSPQQLEWGSILLVVLLILMTISVTPVKAEEMREFYNGVRALGMGGASVATANDETALLSNPAGLGKLRDHYVTIADPEVELGEQTESIMGTDILGLTDPQKALTEAQLNIGKRAHARGQLFPSLVVPNFGLGVFARTVVDAEVPTATPTLFTYDYTRDYAVVLGFNLRIWDGIIKLGVNTKIIDRVEVHRDDIAIASTGNTIKNLGSSGVGIGSDSGLILTAPIVGLPSLAAVYRDVGRTSFSVRDGFVKTTNRPDSIPATLDVALAVSPILGRNVRSTFTIEYSDALDATNEEDSAKRYHGGFEINLYDAVFVRGGWNQRYWTAGLELAMGNYQFQAASYGEEIGDSTTSREDRRYVGKFSFRF